MLKHNKIYHGDTRDLLKDLQDNSIHCCVTSPPYWGLRDYGCPGQIGLEKTPEEFVDNLVEIFREVKRILRADGTLWLNLGDSYVNNSRPGGGDPTIKIRNIGLSKYTPTKVKGVKPKNLIGIPWRVAFALQADGWYLRQDIIWAKPNPMPESVQDRCTKSHEYIFLLSKSAKYYYDNEAIKEPCIGCQHPSSLSFDRIVSEPTRPGQNYTQHRLNRKNNNEYSGKHSTESSGSSGRSILKSMKKARDAGGSHAAPFGIKRNKRSVWTVSTKPFKKAHFATFPPKLIEPCILAGCPKNGVVLDPFIGSGTTGFVARENNRNFIGFDLNPDYIKIANNRIMNAEPQLF